jgi:hypothetical protein
MDSNVNPFRHAKNFCYTDGCRNRRGGCCVCRKDQGLCSYIVSTDQPDAGLCCLLEECKAYDGAKGDFKRPRALYAQLVDITASVADACEKNSSSSDPEILSQLE